MSQPVWQRANVMAAAGYLREILAREPHNARVKALYDGLLEVIEPNRRVLRQQRELLAAKDRRAGRDRRQFGLGPPAGLERRSGHDRRGGKDRRRRR
ncbi:MAG TPA: hypothetical protein VF147_00990 [Vicinamibacterales bacterium]